MFSFAGNSSSEETAVVLTIGSGLGSGVDLFVPGDLTEVTV